MTNAGAGVEVATPWGQTGSAGIGSGGSGGSEHNDEGDMHSFQFACNADKSAAAGFEAAMQAMACADAASDMSGFSGSLVQTDNDICLQGTVR